MADPDRLRPLADPRFQAFLPMLYVAWADGDLEPEEARAICSRLTADEEIDGTCREHLGDWLDPERPPTTSELLTLLRTIRQSAAELSDDEKRSLTDLGLGLARRGGHEVTAAERLALEEVAAALGMAGAESASALLAPERPAPVETPPEPSFDVGAMTRVLDGDQAAVRRGMRELLSAPEFAYEYGLDRAAYREKVLGWTRTLGERGIGALGYPAAYGGADDMAGFIAAFETLAHHDLSLLVKFGVQFGLFAGSVFQLGTEKHHRLYLADALTLALPGCFAMSETGHGSNVSDIETTARYDPETREFVIHTPRDEARKDYIGNAAAHGRMATVFAQLVVGEEAHGVHALLVPIRDAEGDPAPGVTIGDCGEKLGLNGVDNGRLWFDSVRVPRENLLDRFASVSEDGVYDSPIASPSKRFFTMLGTLVGGRVNVALASASAAKSALTIAVRYAARRRQFGPAGEPEAPILDYPSHQRRLMPRLATTYVLHFALAALARRFVESEGDDRREVEAQAAGLKAFATWHATDTIQECREACGGQGYMAENRFAALKADTDVFTTFEGDNTVLLQLTAKSLLTGYKKQFGEMGAMGLVRYVARRVGVTVAELNPIVTRRTDEEHLRDREFHLAALDWREQHLLGTLARRLKKRLDAGQDGFVALVECQNHALALAKAHVERAALDDFAAAVAGIGDPGLTAALDRLGDLYALWRIHLDAGWFLEHGYLEAAKARAIRKLLGRLDREVRDDALGLVDAFDIPDALLAAPIAT